jgi:hypothetical protein
VQTRTPPAPPPFTIQKDGTVEVLIAAGRLDEVVLQLAREDCRERNVKLKHADLVRRAEIERQFDGSVLVRVRKEQ